MPAVFKEINSFQMTFAKEPLIKLGTPAPYGPGKMVPDRSAIR